MANLSALCVSFCGVWRCRIRRHLVDAGLVSTDAGSLLHYKVARWGLGFNQGLGCFHKGLLVDDFLALPQLVASLKICIISRACNLFVLS